MSDTQEIVLKREAPVVAQQRQLSATPADLVRMAVEQNADLDRLERLMVLQERWEANEARKAFVEAMTNFKAEPLEIFKRKQVGFVGKDGNFVGYKHAELSDVTDVVVPAMAKHGLSHRWDVKREAGGRIFVTCVVTHRLGHSESITLDGAPDDSGKKNSIQQQASTITYLQRYTLLAATGLSTKEQHDDDGAGGAEEDAPPQLVPQHLVDGLNATTTDKDALDYWFAHRSSTGPVKSKEYEAFKNLVGIHRTKLSKG